MQGKYIRRVEDLRDWARKMRWCTKLRGRSLAGSTEPCYMWEQCHCSQGNAVASPYSSLIWLPRNLLLELVQTYIFFLKARRRTGRSRLPTLGCVTHYPSS